MKLNLLKLNDDKTELLVTTSRPSTSQSLQISIKVGDQDISPSEEPPKNLGVIFYSTCSLKDHVSNVCRSINFNLYCIGKIRKYLDRPTVEKLVNATITSRLDYCNSLMFGIPKELISQLQKRQNHAARVITKWRKGLKWTGTCIYAWTADSIHPKAHSPIHLLPSTHTSEMSIGVLWQEILCCSGTNTVEQFTPKHQTSSICRYI